MRLIDADAFIEKLGHVPMVQEAIKRAMDTMPTIEPEQQWIPCSDRLPEENGQYLITVKYVHEYDYEDIYSEHGEWVDGKWDMFMFGHCGKVESVTAWMPLPEPWRGEEHEPTMEEFMCGQDMGNPEDGSL